MYLNLNLQLFTEQKNNYNSTLEDQLYTNLDSIYGVGI